MICYKDKTFCSSKNCKDECGRKITSQELKHAQKMGLDIAYGNFCEKKESMTHNTNKEDSIKSFHNPCPYGNEDCPKCIKPKEECTHEMQESDRFRVCKKCGVVGIGTADETKATLKLENLGSLTWNTNSPNVKLENKPKEEWEEEFDNSFGRAGFRANNVDWKVCAPEIKAFIKQVIATHHQKIVEELEDRLKWALCEVEPFYGKGIADALSIIKSSY